MQCKIFTGPELVILRIAMAEYVERQKTPEHIEEATALFRKLAPAGRDEVAGPEIVGDVLSRMHVLNRAIYGR